MLYLPPCLCLQLECKHLENRNLGPLGLSSYYSSTFLQSAFAQKDMDRKFTEAYCLTPKEANSNPLEWHLSPLLFSIWTSELQRQSWGLWGRKTESSELSFSCADPRADSFCGLLDAPPTQMALWSGFQVWSSHTSGRMVEEGVLSLLLPLPVDAFHTRSFSHLMFLYPNATGETTPKIS